MLVPVTFYMQPLHALAALYVIGKAGRFGGSIAAILFNTPGTAAAAATTLDGNALSRKGMAGKALKTAAVSSAIGDFLGDMLLIFAAFWIAKLTREFGPPEYFAIYVCAFLVISSVVGSSALKGLVQHRTWHLGCYDRHRSYGRRSSTRFRPPRLPVWPRACSSVDRDVCGLGAALANRKNQKRRIRFDHG